nr:sigma-70 family RNA polymerase sigma factor [Lachnospiraceae bacterium]
MEKTQYERIVAEYLDMVYKIAVSYAKNATDADDIVQQTFYKLLIRKSGFKDEEHIKRWLIRVCINECNSLFSGFWRRNVHLFGQREGDRETSEDPLFEAQESRVLHEAVRKLPGKCRSVIYLFYYEGYRTQEIAEILHIREATARTRLVRGRKILKEELKEAWDYE